MPERAPEALIEWREALTRSDVAAKRWQNLVPAALETSLIANGEPAPNREPDELAPNAFPSATVARASVLNRQEHPPK